MPSLPGSTETVIDPGLGVVSPAPTLPVVIGAASAGATDTFNLFSTKKALLDEHVSGPGPEAALHLLSTAGGPVAFIRAAATGEAATASAVTVTGTAPSPTVSGDTAYDVDVKIKITTTGDLGTAKFQYSLDGYSGIPDAERTYSGTQTVPAGGAYALGDTGLTVTFIAGSHEQGAEITFTAQAAGFSTAELDAALAALEAEATTWRFVYVVTSDVHGDSVKHAALGQSLKASLDSLATVSRYRAGIIPANMDSSDPVADWDAFVSDRVHVCHGRVRATSASSRIGYSFPTVPAATAVAARAAGSLISTDLKRVPGNGLNDGGPLPRVVKIFDDAAVGAWESWDDAKIGALRTIDYRPGFYIAQARPKSAAGSDFNLWPRRVVMDVACETAHEVQTGWIGIGVRTNNDGTIFEADAVRLEDVMNAVLTSRLLSPRNAEGTDGHVSAFSYRIDRTNNILTTGIVQAELGIRPLAYVEEITATLSFVVSLGTEEA